MADPLTVSVRHVSAKDRMVMRSLITLAGARPQPGEWLLSDQPGGDITIIDVDCDAGEREWSQRDSDAGAVIALTRRADFDAATLLKKPLRARDFFALLDRLARGEPFAVPVPAVPVTARVAAGGDEVLEPPEEEMTLADHLRCGTWSVPIALMSPGWPELLIDPCSGAWFFDGAIDDLDPALFTRPVSAEAGVALTNAELVARIAGHEQHALSQLKWHAGLGQSPGRLHPALRGEARFMLTQVPGEAMANALLHDLARVVLRGPVDLEELLEASGQPEPNVVAFLNACFCSGKLLFSRSGIPHQ